MRRIIYDELLVSHELPFYLILTHSVIRAMQFRHTYVMLDMRPLPTMFVSMRSNCAIWVTLKSNASSSHYWKNLDSLVLNSSASNLSMQVVFAVFPDQGFCIVDLKQLEYQVRDPHSHAFSHLCLSFMAPVSSYNLHYHIAFIQSEPGCISFSADCGSTPAVIRRNNAAIVINHPLSCVVVAAAFLLTSNNKHECQFEWRYQY